MPQKPIEETNNSLVTDSDNKALQIAKGILYQDKKLSDFTGKFNLTIERIRQLLWQGLRDMDNKSIKGNKS